MTDKLTEDTLPSDVRRIQKSDEDWKRELTPEQYAVARQCGTEPAFTGKYWNNHADGMYTCVCCGAPLFDSETKFDSGTGWPSFYDAADKQNIAEHSDRNFGMYSCDERWCRPSACSSVPARTPARMPIASSARWTVRLLSARRSPGIWATRSAIASTSSSSTAAGNARFA